MSQRLINRFYVATRKGLFTFARDSNQWAISALDFTGEPVSAVSEDKSGNSLMAALNLGHFGAKLWRRDGEDSWQELAVPVYPKTEATDKNADAPPAPALSQIWYLAPGGLDQSGRMWAGTIPGGLFRSDDLGASWQLIHSLWSDPRRLEWFGGGYDNPGIHSICVDPRNSKHISIAVSCGGVWHSRDDGASWELAAAGMCAPYMPPDRAADENIQDVHRMVQCPGQPDRLWVQHHGGIYRSDDGGRTWVRITSAAPSDFGFACAVHPTQPQTAWFIPGQADQKRIPVDGRLVALRTDDGGATFKQLRAGLPQEYAYDLVYRHGLDISPDGNVVAFGSTTGNLWLSEDRGENWQCLSTSLPPIYAVYFSRRV